MHKAFKIDKDFAKTYDIIVTSFGLIKGHYHTAQRTCSRVNGSVSECTMIYTYTVMDMVNTTKFWSSTN